MDPVIKRRSMSRRGAGSLLVVAAVLSTTDAHGTEPVKKNGGWETFASVTPWYQGSADIDGGGDFRAAGVITRAGVNRTFGEGHRAGLTLNYDHTDYRFSSTSAFVGVAPWDDVERIGLSAPIMLQGTNGWSYLVSPSVDLFRENGADTGEALTYGAVLAVSKRFDAGREIGLGVAVFDRLEEVSVFPILLIDWKFNDRLRLSSRLPPGPTGGAGLELSYRLDDEWTLGAGGGFRSVRFRLREDGPFPNGIGEESGITAFLHLSRRIGPNVGLDLYAGALFNGQLRVEDANGDEVIERHFDTAPLVGARISLRF